jgi:Mg2+-importing ATPase
MASILTELVLILSIRTKLPFYKSKPSTTLWMICLLAVLLTIFIPISSFGNIFHFVAPSLSMFLTIFALVAVYFVATETVKLIYYRRQQNN